MRNVISKIIQADESRSFCYPRQKHVSTTKVASENTGDGWPQIALDTNSKLTVSYLIGGRDTGYAHKFMKKVAARVRRQMQITTDSLKAYLLTVKYASEGHISCS